MPGLTPPQWPAENPIIPQDLWPATAPAKTSSGVSHEKKRSSPYAPTASQNFLYATSAEGVGFGSSTATRPVFGSIASTSLDLAASAASAKASQPAALAPPAWWRITFPA